MIARLFFAVTACAVCSSTAETVTPDPFAIPDHEEVTEPVAEFADDVTGHLTHAEPAAVAKEPAVTEPVVTEPVVAEPVVTGSVLPSVSSPAAAEPVKDQHGCWDKIEDLTAGHITASQLGNEGCAINVAVSLNRLMSAGLDVTKAHVACNHAAASKSNTMECISEVTAVIASFSHVAEFLTEGVQACQGTRMGPEQCVSAVMGLNADLAQVVSAATRLVKSFNGHQHCRKTPPKVDPSRWSDAPGQGAYLSHGSVPMADAETSSEPHFDTDKIMQAWHISKHHLEKATCANDASNAFAFLLAAGTTITSATKNCFHTTNRTGEESCFISADRAFEALGYAGAYLALMIEDCTIRPDHESLCAGMILEFLAGLNGLADHAARLRTVCTVPKEPSELFSTLMGAHIQGAGVAASPQPTGLLTLGLAAAGILGFAAGLRRRRPSLNEDDEPSVRCIEQSRNSLE